MKRNIDKWVKIKLGDIIIINYGKGLIKSKRIKGPNPVYGSNGIVGFHNKYLVRAPGIIIGRKGAVGEIHLSYRNFWPIDTTYYLSPSKNLNIKFLYFLLKSLSLKTKEKSTAIPGINREDIYRFGVFLPTFPEQSEIVRRIEGLFEKLDAGVEALEKIKEQLKLYRQSVLKAAFSGELTKEWRQKWQKENPEQFQAEQNELEKYKTEDPDLKELPEGWVWQKLSQLGELNRGKSKHRPRNDPKLFDGKYPFIQTGDVKNSTKFISKYYKTYNEVGLQQSRLWPKNTLCITIAANIAESAFLTFDACFPDSIVGFVEDKKKCDIEYIQYFLELSKNKIESYAPATAQKNINLKILNEIIVPTPNLIEQKKIVQEIEKRFQQSNDLKKVIDESLEKAKQLRQSILREAFNGNLTNKWRQENPELITGENSAKALLEKIKAEREKK